MQPHEQAHEWSIGQEFWVYDSVKNLLCRDAQINPTYTSDVKAVWAENDNRMQPHEQAHEWPIRQEFWVYEPLRSLCVEALGLRDGRKTSYH